MWQKWKPGDLVTVTTIDRGLPRSSHPRGYKGPDKTETRACEIVGPSLIGPGWWNVRQISVSGRHRSVFAVPEGEMKPRKR